MIPRFVRAYREWRLHETEGKLLSRFHDVSWPRRAALIAKRNDTPAAGSCTCFNERQSPKKWCACGIYGLKHVHELSTDICLTGTVALWGRVFEHEGGFRAQFAYPLRIFVPRSLCFHGNIIAQIEDAYGVPTHMFPDMDAYAEQRKHSDMSLKDFWEVLTNLMDTGELK